MKNTVSTVVFFLRELMEFWKSYNPDFAVYLCMLVMAFLWLYWLYFVPLVWQKNLDHFKFSFLRYTGSVICHDHKRDTINRLRNIKNQNTLEMPPPYPNGWYAILESSQLRAGEATFLSCLGEELVIFRTQKNMVFVLDAYCPHLGANLGIGGRVIDDCIVCPFHQWSFRGSDGQCTNIPYSTSVPKGSQIANWISQEMNGFIFIWYHAEPTEIPWELSLSMEVVRERFVYHGHNEFYINCHIQEIPENGADIAHFNAIHNESLIDNSWFQKKVLSGRYGYHHWKASWFPAPGKLKHLATVNLTHTLEIFGRFNCFRMDVSGKQIGPSYVCLEINSFTFGKLKIIQVITPIEPLLQKVIHRFYGPRWLAPLMKIFICGESLMFERDINVWNYKVFKRNPILAKEDSSIKQFRLWFSQFYTSNSKSYSEVANVGW
ncbi:cholesterol 7-desaturase nvd [Drosophila gunungcola]|uniref:cholesterol 7-desaturase nvd n=1 Tax=Drosophila gunungcola TaxID=103775 RepID=UPI0022E4E88D|nr:cholesterol 7-desaturase nvd [Drosophila gunungcola]